MLDEIRGAYILLVEDNAFSQQVGQELLEDVGATVVIANNGTRGDRPDAQASASTAC